MLTHIRARSRSLYPSYKPGGGAQELQDQADYRDFVKPWRSMQELGRDIYDMYAEYESEDEEDRLPVTSSHFLLSPNKHFNLNINVGGTVYHLPYRLAAKYPKTRIGQLATYKDHSRKLDLCDDYIVHSNEFFFDRDPQIFHNIFTFYRTGVLYIKDELCPHNFLEEINYWGVRIRNSHRCCRISFEEKQDELNEQLKIQRELIAEMEEEENEVLFDGLVFGPMRKSIWNVMERPFSSVIAKLMGIASSLFVLISLVTMALKHRGGDATPAGQLSGRTYGEYVESSCISFFTLEYLLRLVCTPDLKSFSRSVLNTVDLVAILPHYLQMVLECFEDQDTQLHSEEVQTVGRVGKVGQVLRIMRLMRIFRILKLDRHSTGLRAFGFTLRQCYQQVGCLLLFMAWASSCFQPWCTRWSTTFPTPTSPPAPHAWWWGRLLDYYTKTQVPRVRRRHQGPREGALRQEGGEEVSDCCEDVVQPRNSHLHSTRF
ncbi:hypothetical protein KUCAC02_009237 [Chaenocephalus aceratus]|uniref:Uncharacterized protein n=1 Tax=Chaenocephalus aceratus TaxID=36190 RepID=A0ACB9WTM3_CHAAC|nr:hypothetical protein KUCAC02_009237 [Chaenocephalus aceratus]